MRVVETGHDGGAAQIVDLGEHLPGQLIIEADDPPLVHADGRGLRSSRVLRVESTVDKECIEVHAFHCATDP